MPCRMRGRPSRSTALVIHDWFVPVSVHGDRKRGRYGYNPFNVNCGSFVMLPVPLVNSGDVHAEVMIGNFWVETNEELVDPDDIRRVVLSGAYYNRART